MSSYLVTPQQTLRVAQQAGVDEQQLRVPPLAIMTFSRGTMERMEERCALEDVPWISPMHHPYAAPEVVKQGCFQEKGIIALVPAMGASPMACVVEDLIACGARAIFLLCATWSLGEPARPGDLIVPSFSVGPDGTSIHYGNSTGYVEADPEVVKVLAETGRQRGATVHVGGNASCEALYRITPQMLAERRRQGCLCMENGEASTLFAMAQTLGFIGGVLFQPYIEVERGWDPALLNEGYHATAALQADVALEVGTQLLRGEPSGILGGSRGSQGRAPTGFHSDL